VSDRIALLEAIAAAARLLPDQVGWFTEDEVVCAACGTSTPTEWERGGAQWPATVGHTGRCPWVALQGALQALDAGGDE